MDRRLRMAMGLAAALHLPLIATLRHRLSFDAYTHMFFADHYREGWWSLWEPRWYTGFSVTSYPPLVHQFVAALSFLVGVEAAYAVTLFLIVAGLPAGVYAFARLFAGRRAAGYASLGAALLPSIFLAAHSFGQLTTLAGLVSTLFGLAVLGRYLRHGRLRDGALAVSLVGVVTASHHVTLLFLPFGAGAVVLQAIVAGRVPRRLLLRHLALYGAAAMVVALVVVWPFWQWGLGQTMQTPIDHPSRHNLLRDPAATLFFWPVYGTFLLVVPWMLRRALRPRSMVPVALFLLLFTLGLGGTTPLPEWLYGRYWAWLTYDRFALWASVVLLPFAGQLGVVLERMLRRRSRRAWKISVASLLVALAPGAILAGLVPTILRMQPDPLDLRPVAAFLAEGDRDKWRYLTFGFGDQFARLSLMTTATTIDGSYHTARELPELRESGIGQIDTAYWSACGIEALDPILARAGAHGVRWGFVNLSAYDPLLTRHGWIRLGTLSNGVNVWENPAAIVPPAVEPRAHSDPLGAASWGLLPAIVLTISLALAHRCGFLPAPAIPRRKTYRLGPVALVILLAVAGVRRLPTTEALAPGVEPSLVPVPHSEKAGREPLPAGTIAETVVANGAGYVVAMAFAPDGRLFYTTKGGFSGEQLAEVRIVENGKLRERPFLTTRVNAEQERGLLGIALDPDFATNRYVYIYKTAPAGETGTGRIANRVIRYTEDPATQTALPGSERVLLEIPIDARSAPGERHNGGNLHFGPDGKLYVTVGDYGTNPENSQDLSVAMGKIHRLNPDGSVPDDNPFSNSPPGALKSIWTYGNRNSFDFTFDPVSGRLFFSENGPDCDDEVNLGRAGGNYGWPNACGQVPAGTIAPLYRHDAPVGITGIEFYRGPIEAWRNTLFWCAINTRQLYHARLDPTRSRIVSVHVVDGAPGCAGDVQSGPDGALYLSEGATISRIRLAGEGEQPGCDPSPTSSRRRTGE